LKRVRALLSFPRVQHIFCGEVDDAERAALSDGLDEWMMYRGHDPQPGLGSSPGAPDDQMASAYFRPAQKSSGDDELVVIVELMGLLGL